MNNLLKNAYIFFLYSEILCEISDNKAKSARHKKRSMTSFQDIMDLYISDGYRLILNGERLSATCVPGAP